MQAPPLYIQEKIHPKVLIDDLRRQTTSPDISPLVSFRNQCCA